MKDCNTLCDVLLDAENFPFITLTESKISNIWYHDKIDNLFYLTLRGFKILRKGSKKQLMKNLTTNDSN